MLTPRLRTLMLHLQRTIDATGVSPGFSELADVLGLQSKSGVHRMLSALQERGLITRLRSRQRCIAILRRIPDPESDPHRAFVETVARMTPAGTDSEDDAATLNRLIADAQSLVGAA